MINARSETACEKPSFRNAPRRRWSLIPVNEFFEWEKLQDTKQPYAISMADEALFALAGLWEHWGDDQGNELETFTILTTSANELIGELHDRMPVIIDRENFPAWLDNTTEDTEVARELCRPYPSELMIYRPVTVDLWSRSLGTLIFLTGYFSV